MRPVEFLSLVCSIAALLVSFCSGFVMLSQTSPRDALYESSRETRPGCSDTKAATHESARMEHAEANLQRRVSEMEKHLALMEKRLSGVDSDPSSLTTNLDQENIARSPLEMEAEMEALASEEKRRWNARMELVESNFVNESPDGNWSATMGEAITKAFADEGVSATQLLDVDCRATMCRIQISRDTAPDAGPDFYLWLSEHVSKGFSQAVFQEDTDDKNQNGLVVYMVREGHDFPGLQ